ncbi:MAG TPA: IS110 family transposase [Actinobacteria bacterium]|nr:IS110 family transposase [Actinomycetota bacterium]
MIVVGIDPHKRSHTAVALEEASGASVGERTVSADASGRGELLAWAAALGGACRFAIEDGRPFSGALERSLLAGGYDVVRVPPKLMGQARRSGRTYGKSDPIDARAVALAAIREPDLPRARIDPADEQLRLLVEHRNDLVGERTRMHNRLRDHLHQLEIGLEVPPGGLERPVWLKRVRTALEALGPSVRRRIALELVERCAELTGAVRALDVELGTLVSGRPDGAALTAIVGCGVLSAATVLAAADGIGRFATEARFASHAGVAPLPASSGGRIRHRLNRHGNRQLNAALHRIAFTQARMHAPAKGYLERKRTEGKTRKEALRCLQRHLARVVYRTLVTASVQTT